MLRFEELLAEARSALRAGDAGAAAESVTFALELWRGPALHGLTDTAWFSAEARRLESLRVDALEEQFEAALALGDHREIVAALRAALEENPFRERLWGQLMLALYRCGRQPDALEAYGEARRVLSEQMALEPGPELRRLQEAILTHDPAIAPAPVAPRRRGNLPAPSTSFVGREQELAQVVELLREHRLVTLTGPPGVGKSRLALEVARALEGESRAGAWLVDLARAGSPDDVVRLVAAAVDARGADPLARTVARLRDGDAILLLDACEPVVQEAARVAAAVLAECPGVRVVATSREVLHLPGEVRVTVEPLALPDPDATDGTASPAAQLFLARARAARPRFELTPDAAEIVGEITRHVDGLPLAIELAAARLNALGLAELLLVVERRLGLLRDRPAPDAGRAALGALVEWSYDLLHADEKALLHQVAVHRGGASLPSLHAVGASEGLDEATVTYLLGVLVDKSILSVSFPAEGARYDLLDTVRDYALERLAENGRLAAARRAHAEYFATLADAAWAELRGREWQTWVRRLDLEHDNLWAALTYARDARDTGIAARLASLAWYFTLAERVTEGRRFVELALAEASDDVPFDRRLDALAGLCFLATEELDLDAAIEIGERALALAPGRAASRFAQATLALAVADAGDIERGATLAEQARATLEGGRDHWAFAVASLLRAHIAAAAETPPRSRPWRRTRTATPRRSGSTHSASRRCCSRRGSPSGGTTATPPRTRTVAHSISRATQASRITSLSPCPGSLHAPSRAETCATPKSCSGAPSQPPRSACGLGRRPCARRARSHPRRKRRHRHRREAVPERPRVVEAAAPARAAREPLPRAGRDPAAAASAGLADLGDVRPATAAAAAPV